MRSFMVCLLPALALLATPAALAQDDAPPDDDSPFLEGEKVTHADPAVQVTRPSDSWQFIDVEKIKAQRQARGANTASYATLKAHMWYGAARANVFVRCWKLGMPLQGDKPTDELLADGFFKELQGILRNPKAGKRKRAKVGKRAGVWFEIQGEAPDPRKPDTMTTVIIVKVVAFRPEDKAILTVSLEFSDPKRAKALIKDLKKVLKKVKF